MHGILVECMDFQQNAWNYNHWPAQEGAGAGAGDDWPASEGTGTCASAGDDLLASQGASAGADASVPVQVPVLVMIG